MECPRCGGRLTRYRLDDRETVGCKQCAYVGVSVDHTATRGPPESWDDAIDRFQAQGRTVKRVTREDLPADVPPAEPAEATPGEVVARELADDEDWVLPVFDAAADESADETDVSRDETDGETGPSQEDAESADETPSAESADAGD